jgi:hypothetical protein
MKATNGQLTLSPSDVTAYLACEHLTTLSLAVARGELAKPKFDNDQAELIFRKGQEHEEAYLRHLESEGNTVAQIELEPETQQIPEFTVDEALVLARRRGMSLNEASARVLLAAGAGASETEAAHALLSRVAPEESVAALLAALKSILKGE